MSTPTQGTPEGEPTAGEDTNTQPFTPAPRRPGDPMSDEDVRLVINQILTTTPRAGAIIREQLSTAGEITTDIDDIRAAIVSLQAQSGARPRRQVLTEPIPQSDDDDAEGHGKSKMTKYKKMPKLHPVFLPSHRHGLGVRSRKSVSHVP
eukprot:CAMPEP_0118895390 /NCGR_PEP_ID=MMETSP1166-20130328/3765_1 /TAXON_ID=1104430 /ORGANISM="Chrysoreinhardia sp, Strain CCMP3193" /LENGTH=148 /DNA_ID=CAMNT_0006834411 /DNA_START=369 /DNA_END=815 /DNA_ORIENTATION=-